MKEKLIPTVAPFRGVRYNPEKIGSLNEVTAPPYDVISEEGQNRLYAKNPYNVVRLILGRQDATDTEANNRYTRAAADFKEWIDRKVLIRDSEPSFYLYEQAFEVEGLVPPRRTRRGFLCLRKLEDFREGRVQPHENTLPGPKADRLRLMKACGANFSPIFVLYSDPEKHLTRLFNPAFNSKPEIDFVDDSHVRHRLWKISDQAVFHGVDAVLREKKLFIADGHHRYETSLAYRAWMKEKQPGADETAPFNYTMMFFCETSDPGLLILPTHRVVKNAPHFNGERLRLALREYFDFESFRPEHREEFLQALNQAGPGVHAFGLTIAKDPHLHLILLPRDKVTRIPALSRLPQALQNIDAAILHHFILRDVLKISEADEKDPHCLRYVKESRQVFEAMEDRETQVAVFMNPPPMEDLRKVVEAGLILPPKTTFFHPKLLTGLVINKII